MKGMYLHYRPLHFPSIVLSCTHSRHQRQKISYVENLNLMILTWFMSTIGNNGPHIHEHRQIRLYS